MNERQLNILLADDDFDDRFFFEKALSELPVIAALTVVKDGQELMQFLNEETNTLPDVLFLDINMPCKTGTECLTEMKLNKKLKDIPVTMFSTSNSPENIKMLFQKGANVYIHKPNDFSKLKEIIFRALPISTENIFSKTPIKYILNA
ncbi:MAG: response regulator [Burkholderiales bacterium]|nr:response regulator [Flavobacterium sp.]